MNQDFKRKNELYDLRASDPKRNLVPTDFLKSPDKHSRNRPLVPYMVSPREYRPTNSFYKVSTILILKIDNDSMKEVNNMHPMEISLMEYWQTKFYII